MACWRPLTFSVPFSRGSSLKKEVKVPCNYCLSCRITRSIYLRSIASYEAYMCALEGRGSSFSTLTYCDYNLPVSLDSGLPSVDRGELQKFIKRLRSYLPKDLRNFKFMASGEYGDQFGRPHYHFTVLGLPSSYADKAIAECWNNPEVRDFTGVIRGTVDIGALREGGLSYVTKYCLKQVRGKELNELYDNNFIQPPFIVHSKELESRFVLRELDELRKSHWQSTFFGRPSFVPVQVMKKYASAYDVQQYQVSCMRYLKSKPVDELLRTRQAKERSLYMSNIQRGVASDNDVLIWDTPNFL